MDAETFRVVAGAIVDATVCQPSRIAHRNSRAQSKLVESANTLSRCAHAEGIRVRVFDIGDGGRFPCELVEDGGGCEGLPDPSSGRKVCPDANACAPKQAQHVVNGNGASIEVRLRTQVTKDMSTWHFDRI